MPNVELGFIDFISIYFACMFCMGKDKCFCIKNGKKKIRCSNRCIRILRETIVPEEIIF